MTRLPRLAIWLLERRLSREWLEFVLGDLEEELARHPRHRYWLWTEVARLVLWPPPHRLDPAASQESFMRALARDIRQAVRAVRAAPLVALIVIVTLALGLGANTAIFTIADATVFRPLPYTAPQELLALRDGQPGDDTPAAYPEYVAWRDYLSPVAEVGAYWNAGYTLTSAGEPPEAIAAQRVSASVLTLLGVAPTAGRLFTEEDDDPAAPRVALLAEPFWQRRFGGSPGTVGRTIHLNGTAYQVVGILPASFRGVLPSDASMKARDIWIPLRLNDASVPATLHWLTVVARVRAGIAAPEAAARIAAAGDALKQDGRTEHGMVAVPLVRYVGQASRDLVQVLAAAGALLLLITCANLGSLLVARGTARTREVGIRLAIGASRWHIGRQFLAESGLLALAGGLLGLVVAYWAVEWFRAAQPVQGIDPALVRLNGRVCAFVGIATMLSCILFGLAPAVHAFRTRLEGAFAGTVTPTHAGLTARRAFVVAQIALAVALLTGAGLLARSFSRLLDTDMGFRPHSVLTFEIERPGTDGDAHTRFFSALLERLRGIPGVESVALTSALPLAGGDVEGAVPVEGVTLPEGRLPSAQKRIVSPEYFRTMGIPLLRGRTFTPHDRTGAPPVVVISEAFARRYFGTDDPTGRRLAFNWEIEGTQEIVGVVGDVRHRGLHLDPLPMVYISYLQRPDSTFTIAVHTSRDDPTLPARVRDDVAAIDPAQPVAWFRMLDDVLAKNLAPRRTVLSLTAAFATLALVLVSLGLYGVISFATRQRTREIGVRVALGARPGDILRLVLGDGSRMIAAGLLIGLALAWPAGRVIESQLYATSASDPLALFGAALVLLMVGTLATYVPARNAARLDPTYALRQE